MNPTFIMMVGLPYSGKSYYAEKLSKEYGAVVHSSDAIRAEILGDVQDQNNNGKVFEVLHRRVYDDLSKVVDLNRDGCGRHEVYCKR